MMKDKTITVSQDAQGWIFPIRGATFRIGKLDLADALAKLYRRSGYNVVLAD